MKHILLAFIFATASMSGCIGTDEPNEKKKRLLSLLMIAWVSVTSYLMALRQKPVLR